jgi:ABC-type tungstate transport system permease subunit
MQKQMQVVIKDKTICPMDKKGIHCSVVKKTLWYLAKRYKEHGEGMKDALNMAKNIYAKHTCWQNATWLNEPIL